MLVSQFTLVLLFVVGEEARGRAALLTSGFTALMIATYNFCIFGTENSKHVLFCYHHIAIFNIFS